MAGEIIDGVSYREIKGGAGDDYFTGEGKGEEQGDDWNSESSATGPDNIQARPVSSLPPREQFKILQRWWQADSDFSSDWRADATHNLGFVAGEQLSDDDKRVLDEAKRPHVVFNRVLTIIKAIAGMEINGRHEIVFTPTEKDDAVISEILSGTSKWMSNGCDGEDEQSEAFQQCVITGIGVTESRFSYEMKSAGEYIEEQFDCREFGWDRTAKKKNLVDARRMHRARRVPLSDAMQMFPGKSRRQLDATWADIGIYGGEVRSIEEKRIRDGRDSYLDWDDTDEVTLVCIQWWEREPYYLVADEQTETMVEMSPKEFRLLSRMMRLQGLEGLDGVKMTRRAYKQAFLGSELLEAAKPAPCGQQFSWAVITGEFDAKRRKWFGLTRVVEDPQKWANKFMSQVMFIMNATAKGGILAERDAFDDEIEAEEGYAMADTITWLKSGALSQGRNPKIMEKPGRGDASAYVALLQYAVQAIPQVTGVNFELLGQQDIQNPGVVEAMRKQAGMTVLATLFDSLRRYRKVLGRIRLHIIQTRLSDGRLVKINGQQFQGSVQLAKSMTAGEYDVTVDDAPTSPNQKDANWAIIVQFLPIFKDQLMQNPELLCMVLEYSPLPTQLVAGIKRVVMTAQSDPEKQREQQQVKELTIAKLLSEVSKNDSTANLNNAKAGTATATAAYDVAIAQNMLHDNAIQRADMVIKGKKADVEAVKIGADAELTRARAAREAAGVHHDSLSSAAEILNARTKHLETVDKIHSNRVGALAGAQHDLASAFQKRVAAMVAARQPAKPAGGGA